MLAMNANHISALLGVFGALIGGAFTFLGYWLAQKTAVRGQWMAQERLRRQDLYKEFIEQASKCYANAIQEKISQPDVSSLVVLYAMLSRMRALSSANVTSAAEDVVSRIIQAYGQPPIKLDYQTFSSVIGGGKLDVLRAFAEASRAEYEAIRLGGH